ncbi:hypothetical protein SERLA73DRAFT_184571 [Serpula lacrymans var. lacrymans S7.3]|uniref:Uncharacterized protein n=2 Tax=Serpula lacrymans var. lacrymans TaxID=341189 RepID=F8Q4M8_SERL3|nr:uncharacterized protein SERLADRAFT_472337 [Serpula lacrymans var. lacrymans S7.9]EGN96505.1 hypothetical protein SERLA73DRAFT_184571 [Serpula lacrymans var. lacrymans S7.3]EGO22053.1 hypothetical protein SERLADRAFT_472337 [Serpula lacrymans var. lacrymans S7.9]
MLVDWHKDDSHKDTHLLGAFVSIGDQDLRVFHLKRSADTFEEYAPEQAILKATISFDLKRVAFLLGSYSTCYAHPGRPKT